METPCWRISASSELSRRVSCKPSHIHEVLGSRWRARPRARRRRLYTCGPALWSLRRFVGSRPRWDVSIVSGYRACMFRSGSRGNRRDVGVAASRAKRSSPSLAVAEWTSSRRSCPRRKPEEPSLVRPASAVRGSRGIGSGPPDGTGWAGGQVAAIYGEDDAGDHSGGVRSEEEDGPHHVGGSGQSSQRDAA